MKQKQQLLSLLFLSSLCSAATMRGFFSPDIIFDTEHILAHMNIQEYNQIARDNGEDDTASNLARFAYFKAHDTDDNRLLDGLEILSSLFHLDEDHGHSHNHESFEDNVEVVDTALYEHDADDDGYLSYAEYCAAIETTLRGL